MLQKYESSVAPTLQVRKVGARRRTLRQTLPAFLLHLVLIVGCFIMVVPFVWMVLTSFKDFGQAFSIPPTWIPNPFVWQNYPDSWQALPFSQAYFNSIYITLIIVASQLLTCSMAGYAFARLRFPLRGPLFILFLATLMVPAQLTIIPLFLIVRQLSWYNTHLAIIVPPALLNAFGVFLMRQSIRGIPREIEEAAILDGAGYWTIYWYIILPQIRSTLAALGILSFLAQWNNFFTPLIMLNSPNLFTVPLMLNQFIGQYTTNWTLMMAGAAIAVIPALIVYIFAQRHIIEGISLTGMK